MLNKIRNLSSKFRLNLFYNQILINKKNSIFLFITITFLAFVEMFIIGSLFPIINLFQKEEKILEFMLKIETFTNLDFELNYFIIFVIFSVVSLFFISSLLQTLSFYYSSKVTENIFYFWKKEILNKYLDENISFFSNNKSGDLIQRLLVHTREASSFIFEFFILCKDLLIALIIYIFLFFISYKLTLFFTLIFSIVLIVSLLVAKNLVYKKASEVANLQEIIFSYLSNILQSVKVIKAFQKEEYFQNIIDQKNKVFMKNQILNETLVKIPAIFNRTVTFVIAMLFLLYILLFNYDEKLITTFIVFLAGMYKINNSLGSINNSILGMARLLPNIEIVFQEINRKQKKTKDLHNINTFQNNLRLENINFKYSEKKIINNINFGINKEELVSIVGPSGVGKTTLIDIICNHIKCEEKNIFVDDRILDPSKETLSKRFFGYISQEGFIFPGSIKENINFFSDKIKDEDISEALKVTGLEEFVNSQKKGIDTYLLEGGKNISGGQKQRISIARMICSDFEILVLDESTSHLDQLSEQKIIQELKGWIKKKNKSVICVTHSPIVTKSSDCIYVLDKGSFISKGKHEDLININFYKENFF